MSPLERVDWLMFENRIRTLTGYVIEPMQDKINDLVERVEINTPIIRDLRSKIQDLEFN